MKAHFNVTARMCDALTNAILAEWAKWGSERESDFFKDTQSVAEPDPRVSGSQSKAHPKRHVNSFCLEMHPFLVK